MKTSHYAAVALIFGACESTNTSFNAPMQQGGAASIGTGGETSPSLAGAAGQSTSAEGGSGAASGAPGDIPSDAGSPSDVPIGGVGGIPGEAGETLGGAAGSAGAPIEPPVCYKNAVLYPPFEVMLGTQHVFSCDDDFCIGALDRPQWSCPVTKNDIVPTCDYTMVGMRAAANLQAERGTLATDVSWTYTAQTSDPSDLDHICTSPAELVSDPPRVTVFTLLLEPSSEDLPCPRYAIMWGSTILATHVTIERGTVIKLPLRVPGCSAYPSAVAYLNVEFVINSVY